MEGVSMAQIARMCLAESWRNDFLIEETDNVMTISYCGPLTADHSPLDAVKLAGASLIRGGFYVTMGSDCHHAACVVKRFQQITTPQLAVCLFGLDPKPSQKTAARQWALRRKLVPTNPGFRPSLWETKQADLCLLHRLRWKMAGKMHPGNRTSGDERHGRWKTLQQSEVST